MGWDNCTNIHRQNHWVVLHATTAKTAFVKVKFNDFQSTTVERAWQGADDAHFHELLQQGLERSGLRVRLIGAGVKFYGESDASDMQLDFLDLLFGEK